MEAVKIPCPVCKSPYEKSADGGRRDIRCPRCGPFTISDSVIPNEWSEGDRAKISGWIRDQCFAGEKPQLNTYKVEQLLASPERSVPDRLDRLLSFCIRMQRTLGNDISLSHQAAIAATYSVSQADVRALATHLLEENYLRKTPSGYQVTARGFMKGGSGTAGSSASSFIAMWFDPSMQNARFQIDSAVRSAGYTPVIVDAVEHVNKIDDEIIAQIRKSRFLIADFTGHRGGVYFEAGFALGLGLPVFWTCRKDQLKDLHFDIRQYNCIDWSDEADLHTRLARRIEAVIGHGPAAA